jgi:predicted transcriptional regulator
MWREYRSIGGIKKADFFEYFGNRSVGTAIVIDRVHALRVPIEVNELYPGLLIPQSFCYLHAEEFAKIRARLAA